MSRTLDTTIQCLFRIEQYNNCWKPYGASESSDKTIKFMEIPIKDDVFEIPLFAFNAFVDFTNDDSSEVSALTAVLDTNGHVPRYVSVDRYMRDVLLERFSGSRLIKLETKRENETFIYYGTAGAVFDKDFNPIMVCSYQMERVFNTDEEKVNYIFLKPVLRVSPDIYLEKANPLEKFIVNKMISTCLERKVRLPMSYMLGNNIKVPSDYEEMHVKVELDDSPFIIRTIDTPSISTSNKQLLQLAIDHIDELIQ